MPVNQDGVLIMLLLALVRSGPIIKYLKKQHVRIFSDNTTAITYLNKPSGTNLSRVVRQQNGYGNSAFIATLIFQLPTYLKNIFSRPSF